MPKYIAIKPIVIPINQDTTRALQDHIQHIIKSYEKLLKEKDLETANELMQLEEQQQITP